MSINLFKTLDRLKAQTPRNPYFGKNVSPSRVLEKLNSIGIDTQLSPQKMMR